MSRRRWRFPVVVVVVVYCGVVCVCGQVTLSISILISLHVFFLLVVEIIPPTSLVVPLLGKYLIFAMILVSIRSVNTHTHTHTQTKTPIAHAGPA